MSDLHQAVEAELDAHRPTGTPPFSAVRARKHRRDQRRAGGAVVLSVVAVAGVAFGSSALGLGPGRSSTPGSVAGADASATQDQARFSYVISWQSGDRDAYSDDVDRSLNQECFTLPGVDKGAVFQSLPPLHTGQITGTDRAESFRSCVERVAPGADLSITAPPDTEEASIDEQAKQRLLALANEAAERNNGKAETVQVVRTTLAQANSPDVTNQSDVPVWLMQVSGSEYTCDLCFAPSGASLPKGRYLTLVLSVDGYESKSFGISPTARDLDPLGEVQVLRG